MRSLWLLAFFGVASFVACGARVNNTTYDGGACSDTRGGTCVLGDRCTTSAPGCGGVKVDYECSCTEDGGTAGWSCGGGEGQDGGCPQGLNDCSQAAQNQPCNGPGQCPGPMTACGASTCSCIGSNWKCSEPLCPMDAGTKD